jgi:hypothetical protein
MQKRRTQQALDGVWHWIPDPSDAGVRDSWYDREPPASAQAITIPGPLPNGPAGISWLAHSFALSDDASAAAASLTLDGLPTGAQLWLNGVSLGTGTAPWAPSVFNVTASLVQGANTLFLRLPATDTPAPTPKAFSPLPLNPCLGLPTLCLKPRKCLGDVFLAPDLRRKRLIAHVNATAGGTIRARIRETDTEVTGTPGELTLPAEHLEMWSPDAPTLYTLELTLIDGDETVDAVEMRFGMREFTLRDQRFFLNGHPCFVHCVAVAPDAVVGLSIADLRAHLTTAKDAGLNAIRLLGPPSAPDLLALADELGLFAFQTVAPAPVRTPDDALQQAVRRLVARDAHHPSLVAWEIDSGTGKADPAAAWGALFAKTDPSRVVVTAPGPQARTRLPLSCTRPYNEASEPMDALQVFLPVPPDRNTERFLARAGAEGVMGVITSFGTGGFEDIDTATESEHAPTKAFAQVREGYAARDLERVFGSLSNFCCAAQQLEADGLLLQLDALRGSSAFSGYCWTSLKDGGDLTGSGLIDRWGRPKALVRAASDSQQPLRPLITLARTNLVPREETNVTVTLLNECRVEGRADLSLQVVGPTNQVLWKKKRNIKIPKSRKELWTGSISASGSSGTHRFAVRLMQGMKVLAESAAEFHVFDPAAPSEVEINVVDPLGHWTPQCLRLARQGSVRAPVHVVPPLANTISAYPDNELAHVLAEVNNGAVALVFCPPDDWNELAEWVDPGVRATPRDALGGAFGACHYAKLHPIFDGLPARGMMGLPYRNIVPWKTFADASEEDMCGCLNTALLYQNDASPWGNNILVRRYGTGRIIFTHLRVLQHLGDDPVADRLFANMLTHFGRRSVPADTDVRVHQPAVEWLRQERENQVRRWMVLGPFANWDGGGHDRAYPPEEKIDLEATYPGWCRPVQWQRWHARQDASNLLDLHEALSPEQGESDYGTAYAYAELTSDKRQEALLRLRLWDHTKVWLNGRLVFEFREHIAADDWKDDEVTVHLKQGRNAVLVKVSKVPGPFRFSLDFISPTRFPLVLKWWK